MYRVLIRLLTFQFAIIQILFKSKNNLVLEIIEHNAAVHRASGAK